MLRITGADAIVIDTAGTGATGSAGDLHVRDGLVAGEGGGAGTGDSPDDSVEVLDATGCVITPGLVNAHHHLLQTAFRTLPGTRGVPMAEWLPTMAAAYGAVGVDAGLCFDAASAGLAESLLNGVTTVADHHLTWPADASTDDTVAMATATATAARGLGARLVFVRGTARDDPERAALSAEAIAGALLPGAGSPTPGDTGGGVRGGAGGGLGRGGIADDGMLQLAVGPAGVHSDSPETFRLLGEVAARFGLRRRTQSNEQVDVAIALERYGRRPLELLEEWGWLAPDVTLAHLCDVTADEIARIAASGATATHAPGCDLPMGWGIAPVAALMAAGVAVGLGTSGGGSNDASHLLADARLAMQVAPLVGPPINARTVLGMATAGSAAGLGRPELGHLRPGAAADLCVWDVSGVADAGVADPIAGLLWASPGRRPRHVVVGGRVVVRDGQLVTGDERGIVQRLRARVGR
ncbi:amidohydrolase family protein [Marisediminicola senii]|uniref:amidohydrolase family protein n=1 Tax=Marisediminicola senii TaxID=2711233 RepID=UPI0013EC4005|nr:amidohydrolase family protein [Marisediminicola senii]